MQSDPGKDKMNFSFFDLKKKVVIHKNSPSKCCLLR